MQTTIQSLEYLPLQTTMPLMNPKYPPQYFQTFTLLKKHIQLQLWTPQTNSLAQQLIPFGQTNYNCWYAKKMCYLSGTISCEHELSFSEKTLFEKIKNFQLWEHRRFIIQRNPQYLQAEYTLVQSVLDIQPKNYHAWSHRIWIVDQLQNYHSEIDLTQTLLQKDPYNNSVWAYRVHLIKKILQNQQNQKQKQKILDQQLTACLAWLSKHLDNLAAWNYLRGYLPSIKLKDIPCKNEQTFLLPLSKQISESILSFVKANIEKLENLFKDEKFVARNHHYESQIQLLTTLVWVYSQDESTVEFAKNSCLVLGEKDYQKRFYWKWVFANL